MIEKTNSIYHSVYSEPVSKNIRKKQGISSVDAVELDTEKDPQRQEDFYSDDSREEHADEEQEQTAQLRSGALNIVA